MWTPERIRDLRQNYGEKQIDFCRRLGVSLGALRNYEQGISRPIGPAELLLSRLEEDLKEGRIRELQAS